MAEQIKEGKRWSGADWGDQQRSIMVVGQGGIGSWLTLCLSRIGHHLTTIDPDMVDTTNVEGGQMFRTASVGRHKTEAVRNICREFGCNSYIGPIPDYYSEEVGMLPIVMSGVDNMDARRDIFDAWKRVVEESTEKNEYLFIDGRLNLEDFEILCVQGNNPEQIRKYEEEYLFDDSEVPDADCTVKQSTHTAMGIASWMTATLCNWLTNKKLGFDIREIPFQARVYYPGMLVSMKEAEKEVLV